MDPIQHDFLEKRNKSVLFVCITGNVEETLSLFIPRKCLLKIQWNQTSVFCLLPLPNDGECNDDLEKEDMNEVVSIVGSNACRSQCNLMNIIGIALTPTPT